MKMNFDMTTSDGIYGGGGPIAIDKAIYYFARKWGMTVAQLEELNGIIEEYKALLGVAE